jgi:hypothetical protein
MLSNNTIVLAAVAVSDKIDMLHRRKAECTKWMKEGDQSEENQNFWTQHIESLEKDVLDYTKAKQELINS